MTISRRHCLGMACILMLAGCASGPDEMLGANVLSREEEEALNRRAGVEVEAARGGVHMRLPEVVLFEFNQAGLRSEADPVLSRSAALLNRSSKPISIEGHSDNIGTRERNTKLSTARAEVVGRAVIGRGVAASRITYQGYGFDRPVASNETAAGRALNRRTEIFLKGETMDTLMGSTQ
jgi:outer membrane protein OmpA-like peptidoglycan-associated protein